MSIEELKKYWDKKEIDAYQFGYNRGYQKAVRDILDKTAEMVNFDVRKAA